jgi:hypothetical protein
MSKNEILKYFLEKFIQLFLKTNVQPKYHNNYIKYNYIFISIYRNKNIILNI